MCNQFRCHNSDLCERERENRHMFHVIKQISRSESSSPSFNRAGMNGWMHIVQFSIPVNVVQLKNSEKVT